MNIQTTIETLIQEYINEPDKKNIQHIQISIENHYGHFFIVDSAKLIGVSERSEKFQLAIYFSFNNRTKKGKAIQRRIEQSATFNNFKNFEDKNSAVFVANTNNDKKDISKTVEDIVNTIFPSFDISKLKIELKKTKEWITIREY